MNTTHPLLTFLKVYKRQGWKVSKKDLIIYAGNKLNRDKEYVEAFLHSPEYERFVNE